MILCERGVQQHLFRCAGLENEWRVSDVTLHVNLLGCGSRKCMQ